MKLPAGWKQTIDATGATYYTNAATGAQTSELQPSSEPLNGWRKCQSSDGSIYYYNDTTGVSSWDIPAELDSNRAVVDEMTFTLISPRAPLPLSVIDIPALLGSPEVQNQEEDKDYPRAGSDDFYADDNVSDTTLALIQGETL